MARPPGSKSCDTCHGEGYIKPPEDEKEDRTVSYRRSSDTEAVQAVLTLMFIPLSIFLSGVVLSSLWNWFVVPVTDFRMLTIGPALGLGTVVGFFKIGLATSNDKEVPFLGRVIGLILGYLFIWGIGSIIHLCIS